MASIHDPEGYWRDQAQRITLLERRLATSGGGGDTTVFNSGQSFMTPTSVTGGTFDPFSGRITLDPNATAVTVNGIFTADYRAYRITYGWYTGAANGLLFRLTAGGVPETANVYTYSYVVNTSGTASANVVNSTNGWVLSAANQVGHHGAITVFEPMTTAYNNNQKRYVANISSYGLASGSIGGIIQSRDTTPYDGFTILNASAGAGVTPTSGSWVMVEPVASARNPIPVPGSGGLPDKGTTSFRNTTFGIPANTAEQVALANQVPVWFNVDKGYWETYYAPTGTAGLTAKGLVSGFAAGWYPQPASLIAATRVKDNGFQAISAGVVTAPNLLNPALTNIGGFTMTNASNLIPPIGGYYDISSSVYFSGAAAMAYVSCIVRLSGGGAELISARMPGAAADGQTGVAASAVLLQAGVGVELVAQAQSAHNIYGDGVNRRTFLTLRYAGPPVSA